MKSLDEIMSREGEATPASDQHEPQNIEQPAAPDAEASQPQDQGEQVNGDPQEGDQSGMVPVGALHAERAKSRKYTDELAETRRSVDELRNLVQALQRQPQPQAPQQPQPPQEAPNLWDDPDKYVEHRLQEALAPVQQAMLANARMAAEAYHKPETVKEAEAAFNAAAASGQMDPELHRRINSSPNPFHAAVQWHQQIQRQQAFSRFGDDPEAAIEAEVQRRLAARGTQPAQPSPQQPGSPMPSSFAASPSAGGRAAPQWGGPKPLSEIMGGR